MDDISNDGDDNYDDDDHKTYSKLITLPFESFFRSFLSGEPSLLSSNKQTKTITSMYTFNESQLTTGL